MMSVRVLAGNTIPTDGFNKEAWKGRLFTEVRRWESEGTLNDGHRVCIQKVAAGSQSFYP